jgi:hypothetical protein
MTEYKKQEIATLLDTPPKTREKDDAFLKKLLTKRSKRGMISSMEKDSKTMKEIFDKARRTLP